MSIHTLISSTARYIISIYIVYKLLVSQSSKIRKSLRIILDRVGKLPAQCKENSDNVGYPESEETSVFAAISTVFAADVEQSLVPNRITVRILSKKYDYESVKPAAIYEQAKELRSRAEHCNGDFELPKEQIGSMYDQNNDKTTVYIDVQATIESQMMPGVMHGIAVKMTRSYKESIERTLQRLGLSLVRRMGKYDRRHGSPQGLKPESMSLKRGEKPSKFLPVCIRVSKQDSDPFVVFPIDRKRENSRLWQTLSSYSKSRLCMQLRDDTSIDFELETCPPTIVSIQTFEDFTASVFVGVPLVVQVESVHASHVVVSWLADGEEVCRDSHVYTPQPSDIDKTLRVLLVPQRHDHSGIGCEEAYQFIHPVQLLPPMPIPQTLRAHWMVPPTCNEDSLRVMTYNLLADMYTIRDVDQDVMYNHCSPELLHRSRRMPMLLYEMLAYHADIICLQEVDSAIYKRLLEPVMKIRGYEGFYSNKGNVQLEGCATFWSRARFASAKTWTVCLCDLFRKYSRSETELSRIFANYKELQEITCGRIGQILQICELTMRCPGQNRLKNLIVGNTHLFYHPLAHHVRVLQTYVMSLELQGIRRVQKGPCPLILCGDFNADPLSGPVRLLLNRKIGPQDHDVWRYLDSYKWEMGEEGFLLEHGFIGGKEDYSAPAFEDQFFENAQEQETTVDRSVMEPPLLQLPFDFPELQIGYSIIPEFTNLATDFAETLDYIFVSKSSPEEMFGLELQETAPLPTKEWIKKYRAMPNEFMPSDHVSVVATFSWTCYKL